MALNMPVFYKRTGSAIVFAAIMLVGLLWNNWSFTVLLVLIGTLCIREYFMLMGKITPGIIQPVWLQIAITLLSIAFTLGSTNPFSFLVLLPAAGVVVAALIIISILAKENALQGLLQGMTALLYITAPMLFLAGMHFTSFILPIALILMIWTNDTMAYLVGSFIGKTPFSPISPKKTWEGTGGGALLTMIGAMVYGYFSHKFRLVDWAVLGLCAAVAGTLGDLVESKLKRMANVKDSGNIMPGHGGALDRFDSLLLAAPFAGAYVYFFM